MAQGETVLHRWFEEVWNQRRESAIDEMMAENYIGHGLPGPDGKEVQGRTAFKPFFRHFCQAFPDLRITVEDALVDGDKVVVRCSVTGTHTGPGVVASPTNKAASFTGICIARIENGKIAEGWNNFDFLSMYQQLGMQLS
jgi:predicted ester cyclase